MNVLEAVDKRVSCRAYADRPVESEKVEQIRALMEQANEEGNLHLQLYGPDEAGNPPVKMSATMFDGPVYYYIACACTDDPIEREKIGYYGEKLVLLATQLGLGTCWVGSTYDKSCEFALAEGEQQLCIITIGYAMEKTPLKQRTIRATVRRKTKTFAQATTGEADNAPAWFKDGVECAIKAPTAVHAQPFAFDWSDGVARGMLVDNTRPIQDSDLGIVKLHFEIGSKQNGTWEWGSGGKFVIQQGLETTSGDSIVQSPLDF